MKASIYSGTFRLNGADDTVAASPTGVFACTEALKMKQVSSFCKMLSSKVPRPEVLANIQIQNMIGIWLAQL
jgi:hypothetical protein